MPAKTEKQRRFMGAELSRARAGEKTRTGMSEEKLSEFASKSIDAYLYKHAKILPCGHRVEEGSDIDKACTMSNCGGTGGIGHNPQMGRSGTTYAPSTDNVPSGIHLPSSGSSGPSAASFATYGPKEGGFNRSADPVDLINRYLNKQSRLKCGHKKGDPNHLEAA